MTKRKNDNEPDNTCDAIGSPQKIVKNKRKRRKKAKIHDFKTNPNEFNAVFPEEHRENESPILIHGRYSWPEQKHNPHLQQALHYHEHLQINNTPFDDNNRILSDTIPRMQYYQRKGHIKSTMHWGQRKLLMSEIEFLTNFGEPSRTVLYVGAAPGTHINYLATLFPDLNFVLVDPREFHAKPTEKIQIIQEFFTDEMAYKYRGCGVLFISDIRTASWQNMDQEDVEEYVEKDNIAQMRWHGILRPLRSMLKFRLPWSWEPVFRRYLDGDVCLPVWGPQTTTETRLVPLACPDQLIKEAAEERTNLNQAREENPLHWCAMKTYDCLAYQEQMFCFNTVTRVTYYEHNVKGNGLDHCYDCRAEIHILAKYLRKHCNIDSDTKQAEIKISKMSFEISQNCSRSGRLLSMPAPKPFGPSRDHKKLLEIYDSKTVSIDHKVVKPVT
jgi:hypothetical protein